MVQNVIGEAAENIVENSIIVSVAKNETFSANTPSLLTSVGFWLELIVGILLFGLFFYKLYELIKARRQLQRDRLREAEEAVALVPRPDPDPEENPFAVFPLVI